MPRGASLFAQTLDFIPTEDLPSVVDALGRERVHALMRVAHWLPVTQHVARHQELTPSQTARLLPHFLALYPLDERPKDLLDARQVQSLLRASLELPPQEGASVFACMAPADVRAAMPIATTTTEQERLQALLHAAVEADHSEAVGPLMAGGADVMTPMVIGGYVRTVPEHATVRGNARMIQGMLDAGLSLHDLRADGGQRGELASLAAQHGHFQVVQTLLAAGMPRDELLGADGDDPSPAYEAAVFNQVEFLRSWQDAGLPVVVPAGPEGRTIVHRAARHDFSGMPGRLRAAGVEATALMTPDADGRTPIHVAAQAGHFRFALAMADVFRQAGLEPAALMVADRRGATPAHHAVLARRTEYLFALHAEGVEANALMAMDREGNTPMHCAAIVDSPEAIDALLQIGVGRAALVAGDHRGLTPAHKVAQRGSLRALDALWAAVAADGSDPAALMVPDGQGLTPIHHAAHEGHAGVIRALAQLLLAREGATPDTVAQALMRPVRGFTPIHVAARYGWLDCIQALLESGVAPRALIEAEPTDRYTAIHLAARNGHRNVIDGVWPILRDAGMTSTMMMARDRQGSTPIHHAAAEGHDELIGALRAAGIGDDALLARNRADHTAADIARRNGHAELAGTLDAIGVPVPQWRAILERAPAAIRSAATGLCCLR